MPQIPTYTSQTQAQSAQYPQHAGSGIISGDEGISAGFNRLAAGVKSITDRIQSQKEVNSFSKMSGDYYAGVKDIQYQIPFTVEDPAKWQEEFNKQEGDLRKTIESTAYNGNVLNRFRSHVNQTAPIESVKMKHTAQQVDMQQQIVNTLEVGDTQAKIAASASSPEEMNDAIKIYTNPDSTDPGALEQLRDKRYIKEQEYFKLKKDFNQKVLFESASILSRTPEGREKLYDNEEKSVYNDLDPNKLSLIIKNAHAADLRLESAGRRSEKEMEAARDDREIEISTLIDKSDFVAAKNKLEFYADLRMLKPTTIDKLRKAINNPEIERVSNSSISARIGLDVIGMNPKTTMAEIDAMQVAHSQGMPGLSLADATKYKIELRNTLNALQDKGKSLAQRDQNQVEQLLRADFGIGPTLIESITHESPNMILYSQFLRELTTRSNAFYGNENPLAIYNEMKPRINDARTKMLESTQLRALYPDFQSLERAKNQNQITEEVFQRELNRRRGLPADSKPQPPAKRQSGSFPQQ